MCCTTQWCGTDEKGPRKDNEVHNKFTKGVP